MASSFIEFGTNNQKWKETRLNVGRWNADCAVFEGKIIVYGETGSYALSNTVEAHDHVSDSLSEMPKCQT